MGYGNTEVFLSPEERETLIRQFLGKTVTVEIDRPIGFHHETKGIHLDYTINYGYLPAPKLDENQEDYLTYATDVYWGIPTTNTAKLDMIGTVTEALSCQHFNYVRPAFYETTMKTKLSGDENDIKVLDLMAERLRIDFAFAYQNNISGVATFDDMYRDGVTSDTLASKYKSSEKVFKKTLEKLLEKVADLP